MFDVWLLIFEVEWNVGCWVGVELWWWLKVCGFGGLLCVVSEWVICWCCDEKFGYIGGVGLSVWIIVCSMIIECDIGLV